MRELVRQKMDTTSIGIFLEIGDEALTDFAELVLEENENIRLIQHSIDLANTAGIAILDHRGPLPEWDRHPFCIDEWQASQYDAYADMPDMTTHRITRKEVAAMKEFLKSFRTIEEYAGWLESFEGPEADVYGDATEAIPTKNVVDEVCRRLERYRGRKITFEELAFPSGWDTRLVEIYGPPVPEVEDVVMSEDVVLSEDVDMVEDVVMVEDGEVCLPPFLL